MIKDVELFGKMKLDAYEGCLNFWIDREKEDIKIDLPDDMPGFMTLTPDELRHFIEVLKATQEYIESINCSNFKEEKVHEYWHSVTRKDAFNKYYDLKKRR